MDHLQDGWYPLPPDSDEQAEREREAARRERRERAADAFYDEWRWGTGSPDDAWDRVMDDDD